jgi:hypothetical protein
VDFLRHLLDTRGFPAVAHYGHSWEGWLIAVWILGRFLTFCAYLVFIWAFWQFVSTWRHREYDLEKGAVHLPRVGVAFLLIVVFQAIQAALLMAGFWWPAFRLMGWMNLLASGVLLLGALKTVWAINCSLKPGAGSVVACDTKEADE